MAKAIPIANAQPIWKIEPKAEAPIGLAPLSVKVVTAAIPGKLQVLSIYWPFAYVIDDLHVEEHPSSFGHTFSQPAWSTARLASIRTRGISSTCLECSKLSFRCDTGLGGATCL